MNNISKRSATRWSVGLAAVALTFSLAAHAAFKSVGEGTSEFLAVGPGGLKIEGKGSGVSASESGGKVTVKAPLTNLKTGISLRDNHLKEALKTNVNKYAAFSVSRSSLKVPDAGKTTTGEGSGEFALNGVTKNVSFKYKAEAKKNFIEVQGHTEIDMTQFKLEQPCYLGVCVDKNVKIKVKFNVKE